jgi:two-component system, cell cycle sensor histidine kinase and response regulator CckA
MTNDRAIVEFPGVVEALSEGEVSYRDIFNATSDGLVIHDENGRILLVNDRLCAMTGFSNQELLQRSVNDLSPDEPPYSGAEAIKNIQHALEHGYCVFLWRSKRKNGELFWSDVALRPCVIAGNKRFIASVRDIDDRKKTEDALRASEERFRRIFQHSASGMVLVSPDFHFLQVNDGFCKMLGYTESELMEKTFQDVTLPEDRPLGGELVRQVLSGEMEAFHLEKRYLHKNGTVVWGLVSCALIRDTQNKPLHFVTQIQDFTQRKQTEETLRESEEKYRIIAMNTVDVIVVMDMNLRCTFVSPTVERLRGFTVAEAMGQTLEQVITPESLQRVQKVIEEEMQLEASGMADPGRTRILEAEEHKKDGSTIWVEIAASFLRDRNGKAIGILSVSRDITERKRAKEEKAKLEDRLRQAQKMESVGRLAGGVAHDFNNMLGVILGHAELALEHVDPAQPLHANLKEIQSAAQRSADLTRQLLAFARKQTVAPKVLDLNDTIASMLNMLHRIIGENIELVWLPGNNVWPVEMDPSQINQILANLCVNARDAIADVGIVTIKTGNSVLDEEYCVHHPGLVPGDYVLLVVSDNGRGMDNETLKYIFEPFFTTKAIGEGTGLGLATIYGIVKQNKGFIGVHSESGQGTIFEIHLPRHSGKTTEVSAEGSSGPSICSRETILLVEDESAILKMTRSMLEQQGYTVLAASTPGEAMRLAREHAGEIHMLMTDVVMPEMNGRELANNVISLYPHLKRLFMSGYTADVIAHHGVLEPGVYFLQKPFSMKELTAKVREVLGK